MVVQRIEREGKAGLLPFWAFAEPAAFLRKHGFAEKLHK
jgi:hypothetical protein